MVIPAAKEQLQSLEKINSLVLIWFKEGLSSAITLIEGAIIKSCKINKIKKFKCVCCRYLLFRLPCNFEIYRDKSNINLLKPVYNYCIYMYAYTKDMT